jgi:hypothetical protein
MTRSKPGPREGSSPYTTTIHILDAPIHLLLANCSAPVALIDAPARGGPIFFSFAVPKRDMESQLVRMCIMKHVTLPILHFPNSTPQATHLFCSTAPAVHGENRNLIFESVRLYRVRV